MKVENGDFATPRDLADLLEAIGLRLHAKNRISAGESGYLWHLAEIIRGAGRLAARFDEDPELLALYGDGYSPGDIAEAEQQDRFLALLRDQARARN